MSHTPPRKRFRFIPYRKNDIVEMCIQADRFVEPSGAFRDLCRMIGSIYHFEFHRTLERLKDAYAPMDPDTDTRAYGDPASRPGPAFIEVLNVLLEKANYEQVTEADLNQALTESSLFKIRLHVDFDDFSEVLIFCRGESKRQETLSRFLGLGAKTIEFTNYERVVVYIRFREDLAEKAASHPACRPGATVLKLFRNVPKADLEMLFPNTRVRMRTLDKLLIGVPAVISGGIVVTTKLGVSLILLGSLIGFWLGLSNTPVELNKTALTGLMAGAVALGGYLWKQLNNFKNRKLKFMQSLTENLYFKNLDSNAGVFHRLVDDAEEEECKEAILAYWYLTISDRPMARAELDQGIESWFSSIWQCDIDFEIDDALSKLLELGLVKEKAHTLTAVDVDTGIAILDRRWDDYFVSS